MSEPAANAFGTDRLSMKWEIRPSVQTNVPFIVYSATRGRETDRGLTAPVLVLRQWCENSVGVCPRSRDCLGGGVAARPIYHPTTSTDTICECASGVKANGACWRGARLVARRGVTCPGLRKRVTALYCPAASLVLSQCQAGAGDRAVCDSVRTPVLPETETHRKTGPSKPIRVWVRCEAPRTSSRRRRAHLLLLEPPHP